MLAIVIPYYKILFFEKTLQSLVNQTDKRFQVYIGDDASPDDCSLLLKKYASHLDFFYQRFDVNLGGKSLVKQWQRCIDMIQEEEWIMILGDDDFLDPNVVSNFYKNYDEFKATSNVIRFAKKNIFENSDKKLEVQYNPILESASDSFYRRITGKTTSTLSEYIFKKEVYEKYKFHNYPLAWHSDNRAWLEFSEDKPIYSINDAVVNVICSDQSITGSSLFSKEKKEANLSFYNYLLEEKLKQFSTIQSIRILHKYEREIESLRKITIKERFFLLPYYCKNYEYYSFKNNFKKIIKTLLNKN